MADDSGVTDLAVAPQNESLENDTTTDSGGFHQNETETHTESSTVVDESGTTKTTKTCVTTRSATSSSKVIKTQIVSNPNMESRDNPFLAEGELSKKADYILEHSRISRSEIRISDPDLAKKQAAQQASGGEEMITPASVANEQSAPPPHSNGKVEEPITPQSVNVELQAGKPASPDEKEPTDPKKKDKTKGKCCVLQ